MFQASRSDEQTFVLYSCVGGSFSIDFRSIFILSLSNMQFESLWRSKWVWKTQYFWEG